MQALVSDRDVLPSRERLLEMLVRAQAGASFAPVGWLVGLGAGLAAQHGVQDAHPVAGDGAPVLAHDARPADRLEEPVAGALLRQLGVDLERRHDVVREDRVHLHDAFEAPGPHEGGPQRLRVAGRSDDDPAEGPGAGSGGIKNHGW